MVWSAWQISQVVLCPHGHTMGGMLRESWDTSAPTAMDINCECDYDAPTDDEQTDNQILVDLLDQRMYKQTG